MKFDNLFRNDKPVFEKRGLHMDLKGLPPTPERFVELLKLFAAARYNVVLMEWEDSFPWTVDERFRSPTAYSPENIERFRKVAGDLGLELIPLVQCLGHMENPLSVSGYEHLREIPDDESCLNPLAPGARELIQSMVDNVLSLMPDVKHFHLGGDEAWAFGKHPDTAAYVDKHGKGSLYLHHVEPILDTLNERGVRPILWHDMMIEWDSDALRALADKCELMPWGYQGHPDTTHHHHKTENIKRLDEHGFALWAGTAYKGAEGYDSDVPDIELHTVNAQGWADVAPRFNFVGGVATAWSRYAVDTVQCNPIDSSLDSLVNVAVILHDGQPPEGGVEACVEALAELGEKERFESCRETMERMAKLRRNGWSAVQQARQVAVLGRIDERRSSARNVKRGMAAVVRLRNSVKNLDVVAADVRARFEGLLEPGWIEEYLATRIEALREELNEIEAQLAAFGKD